MVNRRYGGKIRIGSISPTVYVKRDCPITSKNGFECLGFSLKTELEYRDGRAIFRKFICGVMVGSSLPSFKKCGATVRVLLRMLDRPTAEQRARAAATVLAFFVGGTRKS